MSTARTSPARSGTMLSGARLVTPEGVLDPGWLRIDGDRIAELGGGAPPSSPDIDLTGKWLVPGFVDAHCHGGGGAAFSEIDVERVNTATGVHRAHGTTTMVASLVSAPVPELARQVSGLRELVEDGTVAGIHLEGPFLSAARCGAHDQAALRPPDADSVHTLLTAGRDAVRMLTLAPELTGSLRAVRQVVDEGVIAAIGHTDARLEDVLPAVDAGATVATHLFNGMRPLHHRDPGPVGALLEDERVTVELICDLVHLHPTVISMAAHHVGPERTVLVTDAIGAACASDGVYQLGGLRVTVTNGEPRLDDGSLAGSSLTMDTAFANLVHHGGLPVPAAVRATATRPAELLGIDDRTGSLRPGLAADLVVLDEDLTLVDVMHRGGWVRTTS